VWTADNRVFSVNNSSGTTSMDYDYTGARVKKYGPLGQVLYPFAGYEIGPDLTKTKYFRVGNEIVGSKQTPVVNPEKKFFYHADHLGGTNIITDITGLRVQLTEYDPWGKVSRNDGTVDPEKRFTGQILDPESGLYYYGARYYDPELGRFISPDPIVPSPGDPQSLNRYSYVRNNPVKYIDPTGHSFWSAIGNFFKNLFRRPEIFFATLIVGLVTGGAAYLATGSWIIAGAVAGAFAGLTGAGMSGGNLWQGMLIGMVGGAVGGGVYGAVGGGLEGVLAGAFTGGFVSGGLGTAFNGGNFFQNAMVGAIGSTVVAAAVYGVAKGAAWLSEKWNSMPGTPEAQQATLKSAAGLQFAGNTKQIGDPTTMSDACSAVCGEEKPLTVDKQQGAAQGTGSNNPTWANKFFRAVAAMATVGILDTAEALIMGGLRIAATGGPVGMVVGIPVAVLGVGIGVGGLIFGANSLDLQGTLGLPDLNFPKDHP
jgi:RHS repeat-associated protein